jgi:hypothetical protein
MSPLSTDFVRSIARAVEGGGGSTADVDRLVTAWDRRVDGNGTELPGVLRTFEGERLPRPTEDLIVRTREVFGERDAIAAADLAAALGVRAKSLARMLEPAGIAPQSVNLDTGQRKGYRRGWFKGYFEQLDRAYAAPLIEADAARLGELIDAFGATEVPARPACAKHAERVWRLAGGGPWRCGICHLPADGLQVAWA